MSEAQRDIYHASTHTVNDFAAIKNTNELVLGSLKVVHLS